MRRFVQFFQQRDRFQVLAPAKFVCHPLAFFAAVVEIEHGRNCIDAQPIEMKLAQPEECIGDQKITNFVAPVVENVSAPIGMLAFAWIKVLVKRRAVESSQRKRVFRKMRRHPIHNHADTALMQMID